MDCIACMSWRSASQRWVRYRALARVPWVHRRCVSAIRREKHVDIEDGEMTVLTCVDVSNQGSGVCKDETGLVVFVPGSLPGEVLKARIERKGKQSFANGTKLETLKEHSGSREAYCAHAHTCGGCSLQNLRYSPNQLDLKQNYVFNTFKRIGGVASPEQAGIFRDIVGCEDEFHYRNKVEFSVDWPIVGKHVRGSADKLVDIRECVLQTDGANQLYRDIREKMLEEELQMVQHIVVRWSRAFGHALVNVITGVDARGALGKFVDRLVEAHGDVLRGIVNSVSHNGIQVETESVLWGEGHLLEKLSGYTYRISPNSFFQTNTKQAEVLYEYVVEEAQISSEDVVLDLFCGAGSMSLFLAVKATSVYGIEISESSVADARYNAALNGVNNAEFMQGDVGDIARLAHGKQADIVVVDPARAGLSKRAIKGLLKCAPKRLVYVSCNAATQARDVKEFINGGYRLESVRPFDLFPQTMHVECVAVLQKV